MSECLSSHELLRENLIGSVLEKTKRRLSSKPAPKVKKKPASTVGEFKCTECEKVFKANRLLRDHMLCHSADRPYKCKQCPYSGKSPKYLYNHTRKVHVCEKKFVCDQCPMGFITPSKLVTHKRVHTGEKPYKCDVCDKSFSASYCLSIHKYVHTNEKPYKCTYCDYACRDTSTLRKHRQRHLDIEYYFKCKLCDKEYKDKASLKFHIAEIHLKVDIRKFECDVCNQKFRLKATLSNHIQNVHTKSTRVQCEICQVYASNKMNLINHMRVHVAAKPFRCHVEGCGSGFKDGSSLRKHAKSHIERHIDYQTCEYCQISFTTKQDLKVHIRLRHTLPTNKYICDYCTFETTLKTCIVGHIKHKHMRENYSCRICKKVYKLKHYYVKHNYKKHGIGVKAKSSSSNDGQIKDEPTLESDGLCVKILKYESINDDYKEKDASNTMTNLNKPNDIDANDILSRKIKEEPQNELNNEVNAIASENICDKDTSSVNNADNNKELDSCHENNSINDLDNTVSKQATNVIGINKSEKDTNEIEHNIASKNLDEDNVSVKDLNEIENTSENRTNEIKINVTEKDSNVNESNIAYQDSNITEDTSNQTIDCNTLEATSQDDLINMKTATNKTKKKKRKSKRKQKEDIIEDNFADFMKKLGVDINNMEEAQNEAGKNKDLAEVIMDSQGKAIDDISKDVFDQYFIESYKRTANNTKVDERKDQTEEAIVQKSVKEFLSQRKQKLYIRKTKFVERISVNNVDNINEQREGVSDARDNLNDVRSVTGTRGNINNQIEDVNDLKTEINDQKGDVTFKRNNINEQKRGEDNYRNRVHLKRSVRITRDKVNEENEDVNDNKDKINEQIGVSNARDKVKVDVIATTDNKNDESEKDDVYSSKKKQSAKPAIKKKRKDKTKKRKNTTKVDIENTLNNNTLRRSNRGTRKSYKDLIDTDELSEELKPSDATEKPDVEETLSRKITKGMHQCYVCLKVFDTKSKLMDHCKDHFDMCTETTLKKCPLCDYVTYLCLNTHLQRKHNIKLKYSYSKIYQKREKNILKFFYKVQHPKFDRIEIIPSIRYLNKAASMWIDKNNREKRVKVVGKNKLVKKDNEWVIETEKLDIKNHLVIDADGDKNGEYIEKMKEVYKKAKKKGEKMVFPCKNCDKICLTLSALKLHHRKHDTNAKPFKKKVYKYKLKDKNNQTIDKTMTVNTENRLAKPKPIKNKHKCDPELKKFYESNIKGGDVEFWQFLKIFNKLGREKVEDFEQLEKRIDFGVHRTLDDINDIANEKTEEANHEDNEQMNIGVNKEMNNKNNIDINNKNNKSLCHSKISKRKENTNRKGNAFVKVLKLTKQQYLKRLKIKQRLRDQIAARKSHSVNL